MMSLVSFCKISAFTNSTLFIGFMSFISIDNIFPLVIILPATWDQPPGEEPKSRRFEFFFINRYFSFNSINLNEALDL